MSAWAKMRMGVAKVSCGLVGAILLLTGCGMGVSKVTTTPTPVVAKDNHFTGSVFGGQQPIVGATIQLYAAGTSGYFSPAYALLHVSVLTTAGGQFTITGDYTCPSADAETYITAAGGDGGAGNNSSAVLMAALGPCGNLSSETRVSLNEVTTVATAWPLAPFMSSYTNAGTSPTNMRGLTNAFASVNKLSDIAHGVAPGALPAGAAISQEQIYTIANILAACVNSAGGVTGDGSPCGNLFAATTLPGGSAPTDTIGAALNMAKAPSRNVAALFHLTSPHSPFTPYSNYAPPDFTLSITYSGAGLNKPVASAVDAAGNVWVANFGGDSVTVLAPSGAPVAGSPFTSGVSGPSAVAIDGAGNGWITNKTSSTVVAFTSGGGLVSGAPVGGGGLNAPTSIAIDGQGFIWVANSGNSSVTELSSAGVVVSGYAGVGLLGPVSIAVDPR